MKIDNQSALEAKWAKQAQEARNEAEKTPRGPKRDALTRKARQLDTAAGMDRWVLSKELLPPK